MNDLAWRKFPVNTIRNEELDYVASFLKKELACAPYMFYMTAICKCDDDGVFDVEDGVMFSRLMRIGSPEDILNIANMMQQRHIITQIIPNASYYMFTDWEAPERRGVIKSRTAEERRQAVAAKIEAEKRQTKVIFQKTTYPTPQETWVQPEMVQFKSVDHNHQPENNPRPTEATVSWDRMPPSPPTADFFCPDADKNAKNVVMTEREREREIPREREDIESREKTHTENTEDMREEAGIACGPLEGPPATPAEENRAAEKKPEEKTDIPEEAIDPAISSLADEAIGSIGEKGDAIFVPEEMAELEEIATAFFVRNSLIFDPKYDMNAIKQLCERCARLKTDKNPARIVMNTILKQFRLRATTKGDYFYQCKITPQFLMTENTWKSMLQAASALLLTRDGNNPEWQFQMQHKNPEEQRAIDNEMKTECLKYGIDPDDPNRAGKLMAAKMIKPASGNTG